MALREDELLASAWEQFKGLVEQASAEAVLYGGQPTAETGAVLARLDDHIAALEQGRQAYEHKQFVRALREGQRADGPEYVKAMTLADGVTSAFTASQSFADTLSSYLVNASPMRSIVRVETTGSSVFTQPKRTGNPAARRIGSDIAPNYQPTGDVTFGLNEFQPHELVAAVQVSKWLVYDAVYKLDDAIAAAAAAQFAVSEGTEFIKGNGAGGESAGLNLATLPAAQVVTTTGTSSTVAAVDLVKLIHEALKEAYLPSAHLLVSGKTLSALRQLRGDGTNGPFLYQPIGVAGRPTVLDVPVTLCPELDSPGSAGKTIGYVGDFSRAWLQVDRPEVGVQRLVERYIEQGLIGFHVVRSTIGGVVNSEAFARLITG